MRIPVPGGSGLDSLSIRGSNPEGLRGTGQQPLCIDLFCGLGGWAEGFLAEGYEVIGFDIERHRYPERAIRENSGRKVATDGVDFQKRSGTSRERSFNYANQCALREARLTGAWVEYPGLLVLQDVLTLHGSQFRDAAVIVASPPCQAYSYRAMPWKRAKALPPPSNELFDACFRIQREASEAAGRYIPLVVENVKGAQPWVGRAKWHYGSFYLWGDVPALMPTRLNGHKVPGFRSDGSGGSFQSASVKATGQKVPVYSDPRRNGGRGVHLTSPHENADGVKVHLSGRAWYAEGLGKVGSRSSARKQASAEIAKIPFDLANHIARVYAPVQSPVSPQELMVSSQGGK